MQWLVQHIRAVSGKYEFKDVSGALADGAMKEHAMVVEERELS